MEPSNPYFEIFSEFEKSGLEYLIVGGYAAILYGAARMTKDMDIIVDLKTPNLTKCLDILRQNNFILSHQHVGEEDVSSENILKWKSEKNMKALRFENNSQPFLMIDMILDFPGDFPKLYENRLQKKVEERSLCFMGKKDLIEMKSMAGRLQDFQDNFSMTGEVIWLDKIREKYANKT